MDDLKSLFDNYSRQARLFPALLTVFAPLVTVLAWFPELITSDIGSTLLTIASSCGLLYALSSLARSRGKAVEKRLLKEWGGWPSTYLLRHSSGLDRHTRARYHGFLAKNVPNLVLPTSQHETNNPAGADEAYNSAIKWLKERVREKGFPLVDKENAQYGFRRNMRGMKGIALFAVCVTFVASIAALSLHFAETADLSSLSSALPTLRHLGNPTIWGAVAFDLVAIIAWIFVVTDDWVREGGEQYAGALHATCDKLA